MLENKSDLIRCYSFYRPFHMDKDHTHKSIEINFAEQGIAEYYVNGKYLLLKKGDLLVLNANFPHRLVSNGGNIKIISIEINADIYAELFSKEVFVDFQYEILNNAKLITLVLQDIVSTYYNDYDEYYLRQAILYLLSLINKQENYNIVYKAKKYIYNNYANIDSLDNVSAYLHVSKSHLQRIFKEETGVTIGNYITDIKMKNAAYFIKNTDIPISEIDELIGMNSRQTFYTAFKKTFNMSPKSYRELMKN